MEAETQRRSWRLTDEIRLVSGLRDDLASALQTRTANRLKLKTSFETHQSALTLIYEEMAVTGSQVTESREALRHAAFLLEKLTASAVHLQKTGEVFERQLVKTKQGLEQEQKRIHELRAKLDTYREGASGLVQQTQATEAAIMEMREIHTTTQALRRELEECSEENNRMQSEMARLAPELQRQRKALETEAEIDEKQKVLAEVQEARKQLDGEMTETTNKMYSSVSKMNELRDRYGQLSVAESVADPSAWSRDIEISDARSVVESELKKTRAELTGLRMEAKMIEDAYEAAAKLKNLRQEVAALEEQCHEKEEEKYQYPAPITRVIATRLEATLEADLDEFKKGVGSQLMCRVSLRYPFCSATRRGQPSGISLSPVEPIGTNTPRPPTPHGTPDLRAKCSTPDGGAPPKRTPVVCSRAIQPRTALSSRGLNVHSTTLKAHKVCAVATHTPGLPVDRDVDGARAPAIRPAAETTRRCGRPLVNLLSSSRARASPTRDAADSNPRKRSRRSVLSGRAEAQEKVGDDQAQASFSKWLSAFTPSQRKGSSGRMQERRKKTSPKNATRKDMGDRNSSTRRSDEEEHPFELSTGSSHEHRRGRPPKESRLAACSHPPSHSRPKKREANISEGDGCPGPGRPPTKRHATSQIAELDEKKKRKDELEKVHLKRDRGEEKKGRDEQEGHVDGEEGDSVSSLSSSSFRKVERGGNESLLPQEIFEAAHDGRAGPKHLSTGRMRGGKSSRRRLAASPKSSPHTSLPLSDFSTPASASMTTSTASAGARKPHCASSRLVSSLQAVAKNASLSLYAAEQCTMAAPENSHTRRVSPDGSSVRRRRSTDSSGVSSCSLGDAPPMAVCPSPPSSSFASHRRPSAYLPASVSPLAAATGRKGSRGERRGGKRGKLGLGRAAESSMGCEASGDFDITPFAAGDEIGTHRSQMASPVSGSSSASHAAGGKGNAASSSLQGFYRANNRHWQNNCLLLYEHVMAHTLEWPSLTTQWMNACTPKGNGEATQTLLLGTHTSGPQHLSFLLLMEVTLPLEPVHPSGMHFDQRQDYVGFDFGDEDTRKFTIAARIPHEGESNRARFCPLDQTKLASKALDGCVYIFDVCNAGSQSALGPLVPCGASQPDEGSAKTYRTAKKGDVSVGELPPTFMQDQAELVLEGHTAEGWGLEWGPPQRESFIASAADDGIVCLWDVHAKPHQHKRLAPLHKLVADCRLRALQDVAWKRGDGEGRVLLGVGDDGFLNMWDIRVSPAPVVRTQCSWTCTNALAANQNAPFVVATAGADKGISVWDLRALRRPAHRLLHAHSEAVTCLKWAPGEKTMLASGSTDRLIRIFDLSLVGAEQESDEAEDGPPELLFVHGGHLGAVSDFDWNPQSDRFSSLMLASVSEDNALQIWQPTRKAFKREYLFDDSPDDARGRFGGGDADGNDVE
ncbi:RbAp48 [Besnoitia besnoiti]|uniref:RbAp48 n=1 Tax=Besnoitia besnoiti TaxID=94643 RepID=A0A2A9MHH5_BESBE|nr:RbAp48 [Besnoitia besnoiti]PFH36624.1 RbAp48 [Besnoitia besnoiti]